MIQSHAHTWEYVTHACMMAHILEHVYGGKPYMGKMNNYQMLNLYTLYTDLASGNFFCTFSAKTIDN